MNEPSPAHPAFWDQRYAAECTPWDLGAAPAALTRFLAANPGEGRHVLVPGCGSGHELPAFAAAGYQVTAIDFSAEAIARVRRQCGELREVTLHCGDFFAAPFAPGAFDLIYERTFLCALPLERRRELVACTARWLKPGGRLAGLYYYAPREEGPPFGLSNEEAEDLFGAQFELITDVAVPADETLPLFAGCERWQVRRRRAGA